MNVRRVVNLIKDGKAPRLSGVGPTEQNTWVYMAEMTCPMVQLGPFVTKEEAYGALEALFPRLKSCLSRAIGYGYIDVGGNARCARVTKHKLKSFLTP